MRAIDERLMQAVRSGSEAELKALLSNSACDARAKDDNGMTALMWAAGKDYESCVNLLLPTSDALAKDKSGWTALMYAAYGGCESCVKLLIPASDAYAKMANGLTASDLARKRSHLSLVQFIDAYVLAQREQANIGTVVCPGAPRGRVAPRV